MFTGPHRDMTSRDLCISVASAVDTATFPLASGFKLYLFPTEHWIRLGTQASLEKESKGGSYECVC